MLRYILNRYVLGFLALTVLALVLINITGQDRANLTPVEKIIKSVASPVQSGITTVVNGVGNTFNAILSVGSLKEENTDLKRRVASLEAENLLLKEYEYQNLRLRELLQFKDTISRSYETVSASVAARNPSNDFKTVTINRGEDDGVRKDMAVITSMGLVGRVINTSGKAAEVLLIIDKSSSVGGLVQVTRTPGLIEGSGDNSGYLKMHHVYKEAPLREKQVVITSGLGGVFPKGLPVGRVTKVEIAANGLEKIATIRPFADFNRLEEVMVIKTVFGENIPPSGGGE